MCGGTLEAIEGTSTLQCSYCESTQTVHSLDNEVRNQMFDRANYYRMCNEFDKAIIIYENLIKEAPEEAEAYWGLCLCKYGIEYVEDHKTGKRIPTCHRTHFKSILEDKDYLSALKYADAIASNLYRNEAEYIDSVQKNIISISNKEKPFDIFICYKESDESGNRTVDSTIAQDIYTSLTEKGYNVFFSRITLEEKLGSAYEPYIFAALNSAKIMLVIGTKQQYFNAVWVKNEWSRYLSLIEQGQKKCIIPCYRDMSVYDLPEQFVALQSQDLSKIGYMQDLLRGIEKLIGKKQLGNTQLVTDGNAQQTAPLIKRMYMFLDDSDWNKAEKYCEKVLDINPECADAYIGKLMVNFKLHNKNEFSTNNKIIHKDHNFIKAFEFGDQKLKDELIEAKNQAIYNICTQKYKAIDPNLSKSEQDYINTREEFKEIIDYSDSKKYYDECTKHINEFGRSRAIAKMTYAKKWEEYLEAMELFEALGDYRDSELKKQECYELFLSTKEKYYNGLVSRFEKSTTSLEFSNLQREFNTIKSYKESSLYYSKCETLASEYNKRKKSYDEKIHVIRAKYIHFTGKVKEQMNTHDTTQRKLKLLRVKNDYTVTKFIIIGIVILYLIAVPFIINKLEITSPTIIGEMNCNYSFWCASIQSSLIIPVIIGSLILLAVLGVIMGVIAASIICGIFAVISGFIVELIDKYIFTTIYGKNNLYDEKCMTIKNNYIHIYLL